MSSLERPSSADGWQGGASQTSKYIPYRNSLLTMVLRDSLGEIDVVTNHNIVVVNVDE